MDKFNKLCYEILSHSPNYWDLAPSALSVFTNLERWFGRKRFGSNDKTVDQTNTTLQNSTQIIPLFHTDYVLIKTFPIFITPYKY